MGEERGEDTLPAKRAQKCFKGDRSSRNRVASRTDEDYAACSEHHSVEDICGVKK